MDQDKDNRTNVNTIVSSTQMITNNDAQGKEDNLCANKSEGYADVNLNSKNISTVKTIDQLNPEDLKIAEQKFNHDKLVVFGRENTVKMIENDLHRTFPALKFFNGESLLKIQLRNVLEAYTFFRPDLGYVQGMSYLAGMLLL